MSKRSLSFLSPLFTLLIVGVLGLVIPLVPVNAAALADGGKAHLVVQLDSADNIVRHITFSGASISGMDALKSSGLEVETKTASFGEYVCKIEGVGDCSDTPSTSKYWGYQYWDAAASQWKDYMVGAGSSVVSDGGVEGWAYGDYGTVTLPPAPRLVSALKGLNWMQLQQDETTGGYGSTGSSAEALLAVGSNRILARDWKRQETTPSLNGYWMGKGASYSHKSGDAAGKMAAGLAGAGGCWLETFVHPSNFYNSTSGAYASGAGPQSWAMLGSAALGDEIPAEAVQNLKSLVLSSHGWEWQTGFGTDSNTTSLAVQALIAAGEPADSAIIVDALAYLKTTQNTTDGGFTYSLDYGTASDADSTAYAVMAIRSAGQDPAAWTVSGGTVNPLDYLLSLQLPDGGFEWQKNTGANLLATQQSITALLGKYYPLAGSFVSACPSRYIPLSIR